MKRHHYFNDGRKLTCCAKLHKIRNQIPYFSLTGEITDKKGETESFGCLHEEILRVWPDLKDLADLHLSDENGIPLHAFENGFYFAGGYHKDYSDARSPKNLAKHLRISEEKANEICVQTTENPDKEVFRSICWSNLERWNEEAKEAVKKFNLKVENE